MLELNMIKDIFVVKIILFLRIKFMTCKLLFFFFKSLEIELEIRNLSLPIAGTCSTWYKLTDCLVD